MKPGWQTSEFWITIGSQLLAFLALVGLVPASDRATLESALASAVTAIFTVISSAAVVFRYIRSRSELKGKLLLLPLVALLLLFGAAPVRAEAPVAPTCIVFGRQRTDPAVLAALQQLAQNQQTIIALLQQQRQPAPAPPSVIVLTPPAPQIPLGGAPRQEIPLGGAPRQDVPLGGPPRQNVPLGPPAPQRIPLGEPKPMLPPAGTPKPPAVVPQRYQPALYR